MVRSVTGRPDDIDKEAIKTLHQFCKKDIELDQFLSDIQSTASLEFNKLLDMILERKEEQEAKKSKIRLHEEKKRRWMKEWSEGGRWKVVKKARRLNRTSGDWFESFRLGFFGF